MAKNAVGYRNPPSSGQFKKGISGNPKGRPKGSRTPLATINKIFGRKFKINEGGKPRTVEAFELILLRLMEQATKGNPQAIRLCLNVQQWASTMVPPEEKEQDTIVFSLGPKLYFLDEQHHEYLTPSEVEMLRVLYVKLNLAVRENEREPEIDG